MVEPTSSSIHFAKPGNNAPTTLLADVEVEIHEGLCAGMTLVGIGVWRRKDDPTALFVAFPGRTYQDGEVEKRWDYLRPSDGRGQTAKAARDRILEAYKAQAHE